MMVTITTLYTDDGVMRRLNGINVDVAILPVMQRQGDVYGNRRIVFFIAQPIRKHHYNHVLSIPAMTVRAFKGTGCLRV